MVYGEVLGVVGEYKFGMYFIFRWLLSLGALASDRPDSSLDVYLDRMQNEAINSSGLPEICRDRIRSLVARSLEYFETINQLSDD